MTVEQFKTLKPKDIIFYVANTGTAGIFNYQYLGVFETHGKEKQRKHLFISEFFLSTLTVTEGRESNSINIKVLFFTENDAKEYQKQLRKEENY